MLTSKIKKITKGCRKTNVYDIINIPDNHNFIANNVVVHNCDEAIRFVSSEDWAKCISGDTKIKTPEGEIEIKLLVNKKNFVVYTFNIKTQKLEKQIVEDCIKTKKDIVLELETECGQKIKCTKEHKFLTSNGWKELQELKKGNIINNIINNNCIIKSIKKLGVEEVYDLVNVNKNKNFIANNFVVHNSENKELKKKLGQVRTKHLLFILCFPLKIYKVEKTYLENYVNYWCLSGDTEVLVEKNNIIKTYLIKELIYLKDYKVATYNVITKKIEYKIPENCIRTKKNTTVYEIELVNGKTIKATPEHYFLTRSFHEIINYCEEYKQLKNINLSDKLFFIKNKIKKYISIKSIKLLEQKEDVYDIIGVPDNHNFIANNIVVHNCDLYARGQGALFVKDKNPVQDSWRMTEFKNVGSYTEFTNRTKVLAQLKKHPNFWMQIKFPRPPRWLYDKYLKVREKNVYDEDSVLSSVSKEDIHRALLILSLRDIMLHDTTLTMNRILLHIKNEYSVNLPKQAVQAAIDDAKQLVTKVQDKTIDL